MASDSIETTKQRSSLRQISAAIEHLHRREIECAITLAAAGEGQLPESAFEYMFKILRKFAPTDDFNLVVNWLKHPSGPQEVVISEFEAALAIARAIHKFVAVYRKSSPQFEEFGKWAVAMGYLPTLLTRASDR